MTTLVLQINMCPWIKIVSMRVLLASLGQMTIMSADLAKTLFVQSAMPLLVQNVKSVKLQIFLIQTLSAKVIFLVLTIYLIHIECSYLVSEFLENIGDGF